EMATGKPAFAGNSRASLIAAILSSEAQPMAVSQPLTPPALEHVVKKCLAKDPDARWQNAADVSSELSWIVETGAGSGAATPLPAAGKSRERLAWLLLCALAVALIVVAVLWRSSKPPGVPCTRHCCSSERANRCRGSVIWNRHEGMPSGFTNWDLSGAKNVAGAEGGGFPFLSPAGRVL